VRPPGSLGGNAQRGPRTAMRQAMVAPCSPSINARRQRVAEFQCCESHPIQTPKPSRMTVKMSRTNSSVQPLMSR
jgi:hypothetical protein